MFIPLRTDRPPRRRPVVTEALIVANLFVYLFGVAGDYFGWIDLGRFFNGGHFDYQDFKAWQLITYQFLHDPSSVLHLGFNMLFLWVFGAAVEDRMTRPGYLVFYLMAGVFAGLAHGMADKAPVIGASGSIAGLTGAFLALFPRSRIKVLVVFFIIGVYMIPSLWFVGFKVLIDLLSQAGSFLGGGNTSRVANMAHLGGYFFGFGVAFSLLGFGIIKQEEFDVFYLFKQSRKRAAFREAQKAGRGAIWDKTHADPSKPVPKAPAKPIELSEKEKLIAERRTEINQLVIDHDLVPAAEKYRELLREAPNTVFEEGRQLDLANQLYAEEDHTNAAVAYELLLDCYPGSGKGTEVRLILGLIYARQLDRPQRARELIEAAKKTLRDAAQISLADQLLSELAT